jgi:hypothetical protein
LDFEDIAVGFIRAQVSVNDVRGTYLTPVAGICSVEQFPTFAVIQGPIDVGQAFFHFGFTSRSGNAPWRFWYSVITLRGTFDPWSNQIELLCACSIQSLQLYKK